MKTVFYILVTGLLFTGCTEFGFEPAGSPPKTSYEKNVKTVKDNLAHQQSMALND